MSEIENLKNIIENWYSRSMGKTIKFTIFDDFISLWIAFNAWGNHITRTDSDRKMIEEIKKNKEINEVFKLLCKEEKFYNQLKLIQDVRIPKHGRTSQPFTIVRNVNNFGEIVEAIYTIRCNLFHGYKNPESSNEKDIVGWAFLILGPIFKESYKKIHLVVQ